MAREKPAVTIRLLRRQLSIAQATIAALQLDRTDKETVIAGYLSQLEEANEDLRVFSARSTNQAMVIGDLNNRIRDQAERLAYLEGYYAAHQENRKTVLPAGSVLISDKPQTYTGRRPPDQANLSPRRQGSEGEGFNESEAGFSERLGDPLWR